VPDGLPKPGSAMHERKYLRCMTEELRCREPRRHKASFSKAPLLEVPKVILPRRSNLLDVPHVPRHPRRCRLAERIRDDVVALAAYERKLTGEWRVHDCAEPQCAWGTGQFYFDQQLFA
jgi:hypothetical protein